MADSNKTRLESAQSQRKGRPYQVVMPYQLRLDKVSILRTIRLTGKADTISIWFKSCKAILD
jgi:hypothetical protein